MKRILSYCTLLGLIALPFAAQADTAPPGKGPLKASVQMGLVVTTGNTKTKNINVKGDVTYAPGATVKDGPVAGHWRHHLEASVLNASTQGETTAERYYANGKSQYNFTKNNYLFGQVIYDNNRFSGFHYLITETAGYGRNLINRPELTLDLEVGGGLRQAQIIETGESQNEGVGQAAADLEWQISDTSSFSEQLTTSIGQKRSVSRSVTALKTQIIGNLSSALSYTAEYTSSVPDGIAKTFTQTSLALVYTF